MMCVFRTYLGAQCTVLYIHTHTNTLWTVGGNLKEERGEHANYIYSVHSLLLILILLIIHYITFTYNYTGMPHFQQLKIKGLTQGPNLVVVVGCECPVQL